MGHGKETPRQKMIGMMYLVLTAMLAMNVSKEVLDAFVIVDKGLVQTTENFASKNDGLYNTFDIAYAQNQEKVGDWKDRADEVKAKSNELIDFLNECKIEIVSVKDPDAIIDGKVDLDEVQVLDNNNTPGEVMIVKKKGEELKRKIEEYREHMVELVGQDSAFAPLVEAIIGNLDTHDHKSEKAGMPDHPWESHNFEDLPLAGVITRLSAIQANVRNVESDVLGYLLQQVDAKDFKVNVLEAIVVTDNSNVFKGQEYKAHVVLAGYDSTKIPEVILSDGTILPAESGKGIYTATSSQSGTKTWGGVVQLDNDGQIITKKFTATYTVAAANAVISPTAMNVLYRGVPNPVSISASGVPETAVQPHISHGNIKKQSAGDYIVRCGPNEKKSKISVYAQVDGSRNLMGSMDFRVKDLPDPVTNILVRYDKAGKTTYEIPKTVKNGSGTLSLRELVNMQSLVADAPDFLFEVEYKVTQFTLNVLGSGGITQELPTKGDRLTSAQRQVLSRMRPGTRATFDAVKAIGPDGVVRDINPIILKIQ